MFTKEACCLSIWLNETFKQGGGGWERGGGGSDNEGVDLW